MALEKTAEEEKTSRELVGPFEGGCYQYKSVSGWDSTITPCRIRRQVVTCCWLTQNAEVVDRYLAKQQELGHVVEKVVELQINCFGAIPKNHQPGKWHLIVDLLHQDFEGSSGNSGIDSWLYWLDTVLPFGIRSGPNYCTAFVGFVVVQDKSRTRNNLQLAVCSEVLRRVARDFHRARVHNTDWAFIQQGACEVPPGLAPMDNTRAIKVNERTMWHRRKNVQLDNLGYTLTMLHHSMQWLTVWCGYSEGLSSLCTTWKIISLEVGMKQCDKASKGHLVCVPN